MGEIPFTSWWWCDMQIMSSSLSWGGDDGDDGATRRVLTSIDISPTSSPPTRFMDMYGVECGRVRSRSLFSHKHLFRII